jgi:hypothetical protein
MQIERTPFDLHGKTVREKYIYLQLSVFWLYGDSFSRN